MRHAERLRDLAADVLDRSRRQAAAVHDLPQRPSGHEFEGEKGSPVGHAHVVDRDDIGMVQRARRLRLEFEATQMLGIVVARQQLQRGAASEPGVFDQKHLTHRPGAEE